MKPMKRRDFLIQSSTVGAALVSAPVLGVLGANQDIRVAVAGFHGHGKTHIANYLKMSGVRLVALCDADRAVLDQQTRQLDKQGVKVEAFQDIRRMLERRDIDAFSIATPNHWHSLMTVWGCQAGKDVCVEKPVSHNIWEGRKMVEAARKYHRVVQGDLDLRSSPANDAIGAYLKSGALGKVQVARGFVYKLRDSIGQTNGQGHIPDTLDYDLWCGPARKGPIDRAELHYDWHWVWDTGCGELGNNGPHQLDQIRWMLGEPGLPRRVLSLGGRFGYDDAGQTPNTQIALYDYPSAPVLFEVRGLSSKPGAKGMDAFEARTATGVTLRNRWDGRGTANTGVIFQCEGGYVDFEARVAFDNQGKPIKKFEDTGKLDPQSNFIKAVRSRRREDLKTDIEQGHLSTCLCHLGNISYRLGKSAPPGAMREVLRADAEALEAFERFEKHLAIHQVNLEKTPAELGPWLTMDSATERFVGPLASQANALLKREYRAPYIIPEQI
jgi:predicted dehydrogenase